MTRDNLEYALQETKKKLEVKQKILDNAYSLIEAQKIRISELENKIKKSKTLQ